MGGTPNLSFAFLIFSFCLYISFWLNRCRGSFYLNYLAFLFFQLCQKLLKFSLITKQKKKKSTTMLVFFWCGLTLKNQKIFVFGSFYRIAIYNLIFITRVTCVTIWKLEFWKASRKHDLFNNNSITVLNLPVAGEIFCWFFYNLKIRKWNYRKKSCCPFLVPLRPKSSHLKLVNISNNDLEGLLCLR